MEKSEILNPLLHLDRDLENELKLKKISALASHQEGISPFIEYSAIFGEGDQVEGVWHKAVNFDAGNTNDPVRILIRPDLSIDQVTDALLAVLKSIRDTNWTDWMSVLAYGIKKAADEFKLNQIDK
jgi:hypothetical protein